jgi:hypothetical protein
MDSSSANFPATGKQKEESSTTSYLASDIVEIIEALESSYFHLGKKLDRLTSPIHSTNLEWIGEISPYNFWHYPCEVGMEKEVRKTIGRDHLHL